MAVYVPIVMHGLRLFIVVLQELHCLPISETGRCRVTKLGDVTATYNSDNKTCSKQCKTTINSLRQCM